MKITLEKEKYIQGKRSNGEAKAFSETTKQMHKQINKNKSNTYNVDEKSLFKAPIDPYPFEKGRKCEKMPTPQNTNFISGQERAPMQANASPTTKPSPIFLPLEPELSAEAGSSAVDAVELELDPDDDFFVAGEGASAGDLTSKNSAGNSTLST
ncbi:hypothetical protein SCA6_007131 [Theobroma cacao]